ncbi:probable protein S-acyltransferase 4 [Olea europaea var. sylvestris]|nr:probable protein S-acyltransferase 4 [Olea europaea var. sylvestris]
MKENPYNKGLINNIKEVFFSKIPPSSNDFRAYIQEDDMEIAQQNAIGSISSSMEKIDIEIGVNFGEENGLSLPEILRNLECDEIEDSMKQRDGSRRNDSDLLLPIEQEGEDSTISSSIKVNDNAEEKLDGATGQA